MADIDLIIASASGLTAASTLIYIVSGELMRRRSAAAADLTALQTLVLEQYRDAPIPPTYEIEIHLDGHKQKSNSIKLVRDKLWRRRSGSERTLEDWNREWCLRVETGFVTYPVISTAECQLAMELSHRLERLGWSAYYGLVPLKPLLAIVGDQIVDDWHAAKPWNELYRAQQGTSEFSSEGAINYHRRHAEWIGLIASVYMYQFGYKLAELLVHDPNSALHRAHQLMRQDFSPAPWAVRREVARVLRSASTHTR